MIQLVMWGAGMILIAYILMWVIGFSWLLLTHVEWLGPIVALAAMVALFYWGIPAIVKWEFVLTKLL